MPPSPPNRGALGRWRRLAWVALPALLAGHFVGVGLARELAARNTGPPMSQPSLEIEATVALEGEVATIRREAPEPVFGERPTRMSVARQLASTDPEAWLQGFGVVTQRPLADQ